MWSLNKERRGARTLNFRVAISGEGYSSRFLLVFAAHCRRWIIFTADVRSFVGCASCILGINFNGELRTRVSSIRQLLSRCWRLLRNVEAVEQLRDTCLKAWAACNRDWEISAFLQTMIHERGENRSTAGSCTLHTV